LLALVSGSSLDQQSNNVTLFNLVEQLNVPPGAPLPTGTLPVEVHAYFALGGEEVGQSFDVRIALVADSGLETYTDTFTHRPITARYRTRTLGLPAPPVLGTFRIHVDVRANNQGEFVRDPLSWPLTVVEAAAKPPVVH
jgi:hypothetical protein